jgi:integrase
MQPSRYARSTGSVTLLKRKRGPVYFAKLRLPDGRQVQRKLGPAAPRRGRPPVGSLTSKMAEDRLRELLVEADRGTLAITHAPTGEVRTFADAAAEWLHYVEHDKQCRPSTLRDYRSTVHACLLPAIGADTPIADITTKTINQLRERLIADGHLSRRSVQKAMISLHGILKRAKRLEWITSNPAENAERIRIKRSGEFNVLSPEQVLAVAAAAGSEQDSALITVAAFTGLRLGELRALRWSDIDFELAMVRVQASFTQGQSGPPKSGKVRSVPMTDHAAKALDQLSRREQFTGPDDLVFCSEVGEHRDDSMIRRMFYTTLTEAGFEHLRQGPRPFRFHDLRHTFGTLAVKAWPISDVQAYMGHADIQTTMIYVHHQPRTAAAAELTKLIDAATSPGLGAAALDRSEQRGEDGAHGDSPQSAASWAWTAETRPVGSAGAVPSIFSASK